ncbi:unnamed protein product, partial [marine sediment metagenome]
QENPILKKVINQGEITIFNLQNEISIRKKQIMVDYIYSLDLYFFLTF